jgi:hypothetical protein
MTATATVMETATVHCYGGSGGDVGGGGGRTRLSEEAAAMAWGICWSVLGPLVEQVEVT